MAFWDLVHEHESDAGGRTQNRLVLELPHEATAEARFQIVRRYAHEFERKGIPFWAAIHAPTKHNDSRNHHAHLVFTDRPMSKMTHPDTGELVWDFTIAEAYKTKSRNTKFKHPYRQNRDPEMRERGYIKSSRARFAQIVNDVMVEHGLGVRYDPRSYADMGLNVAPMANVSRILSDKAKTRSFVVLDAEWTRRMIDAEMQDAAARRTDTFQRLSRVEDDLKKATKGINGTRTPNRHLPRHLHVSTGHQMGGRLASALSAAMLRIERDHLASAFVDEATERTLTHILAATSLKKDRQGKAKVHNGTLAPDQVAIEAINMAAQEEMRAFKLEVNARRSLWRRSQGALSSIWRDASQPAAAKPPFEREAAGRGKEAEVPSTWREPDTRDAETGNATELAPPSQQPPGQTSATRPEPLASSTDPWPRTVEETASAPPPPFPLEPAPASASRSTSGSEKIDVPPPGQETAPAKPEPVLGPTAGPIASEVRKDKLDLQSDLPTVSEMRVALDQIMRAIVPPGTPPAEVEQRVTTALTDMVKATKAAMAASATMAADADKVKSDPASAGPGTPAEHRPTGQDAGPQQERPDRSSPAEQVGEKARATRPEAATGREAARSERSASSKDRPPRERSSRSTYAHDEKSGQERKAQARGNGLGGGDRPQGPARRNIAPDQRTALGKLTLSPDIISRLKAAGGAVDVTPAQGQDSRAAAQGEGQKPAKPDKPNGREGHEANADAKAAADALRKARRARRRRAILSRRNGELDL